MTNETDDADSRSESNNDRRWNEFYDAAEFGQAPKNEHITCHRGRCQQSCNAVLCRASCNDSDERSDGPRDRHRTAAKT
jgi:hypothetical protein